jgi:hypothetical protein
MTIYCTLASGGAATRGQSLRARFPVGVFAVVSHLAATARLVRRVALCNSSMSVITQMLQRVVTMAQTAMAVVDNHRGAAPTRFFTAPDRGGCSVSNPQSRPLRC